MRWWRTVCKLAERSQCETKAISELAIRRAA
jgi:hypothetical protein